MASRTITFFCFQLVLINSISANCVNRYIPGLQQNMLPVTETCLPNQMLIGPNYAPQILDINPYGVDTLVANQLPGPTIIQDSTVANNLANALQLLVVSNLLSNTLPLSTPEVIVPTCYGSPVDYGLRSSVSPVISPVVSPLNSCGFGPYNYIY